MEVADKFFINLFLRVAYINGSKLFSLGAGSDHVQIQEFLNSGFCL